MFRVKVGYRSARHTPFTRKQQQVVQAAWLSDAAASSRSTCLPIAPPPPPWVAGSGVPVQHACVEV